VKDVKAGHFPSESVRLRSVRIGGADRRLLTAPSLFLTPEAGQGEEAARPCRVTVESADPLPLVRLPQY
jgi:hypothetical protein